MPLYPNCPSQNISGDGPFFPFSLTPKCFVLICWDVLPRICGFRKVYLALLETNSFYIELLKVFEDLMQWCGSQQFDGKTFTKVV